MTNHTLTPKYLFLLLSSLFIFTSCSDDDATAVEEPEKLTLTKVVLENEEDYKKIPSAFSQEYLCYKMGKDMGYHFGLSLIKEKEAAEVHLTDAGKSSWALDGGNITSEKILSENYTCSYISNPTRKMKLISMKAGSNVPLAQVIKSFNDELAQLIEKKHGAKFANLYLLGHSHSFGYFASMYKNKEAANSAVSQIKEFDSQLPFFKEQNEVIISIFQANLEGSDNNSSELFRKQTKIIQASLIIEE